MGGRRLLLRGGRVLDPATAWDGPADLLIEDGRIAARGPRLAIEDADEIDASGHWVVPGLIDLHSHLREPGHEYKEDIASGGRAAVAGGFSAVVCMANTLPVNDDPAVTHFILDRVRHSAPVRVYPVAAATRGLRGEVMTEMVTLVDAGAVAFSDDGATIMHSGVMRRVLEYASLVKKPIITHAEDRDLVGQGVMHEGAVSIRLGLPGNPAAAEEVLVARDLILARLTGAHLHVAHVSTAGAVEQIQNARERGVHVTAEVTPHHLTLCDEATAGYDTHTKMAPPLRAARDREACRAGLADGTLDAIATDHAPHAPQEKDVEFTAAPPGVIGFETAVAVTLELVREGLLSPLAWVRRLSTNPARILGVPGGSLDVGCAADVAIVDPERPWVYETGEGYSKSRNSPWQGRALRGRVLATLVAGRTVYDLERGGVLWP